jgi:hypothetical protein
MLFINYKILLHFFIKVDNALQNHFLYNIDKKITMLDIFNSLSIRINLY